MVCEHFVKQGTRKCFHVIELKLLFPENDACRCEHLLQLGRYLLQVSPKSACAFRALGAHVDLGVENLLCCIQLLCVVLEQLPKSSGELMLKLSYFKQNCLLGGLIRRFKDLEKGSIE